MFLNLLSLATRTPAAPSTSITLAEFDLHKDAAQIDDRARMPSIRVSSLTRGPGLTPYTSDKLPASTWSSQEWTTSSSRNTNDYLGFTITATSTYLTLDRTNFNIQRLVDSRNPRDDGPERWQLRFSRDGFGSPVLPLAHVEPVSSLNNLHDLARRDGITVSPLTRGPSLIASSTGKGWTSTGRRTDNKWDEEDYIGMTIEATGGVLMMKFEIPMDAPKKFGFLEFDLRE